MGQPLPALQSVLQLLSTFNRCLLQSMTNLGEWLSLKARAVGEGFNGQIRGQYIDANNNFLQYSR